MSELDGTAGDIWQYKTKDFLTVCTKNLQEITARNEKLISKLGNRQFCKNFKYERHLESKERFAIKKYLLIIGKKKNMQVLSHTFTYFST